jgi:hypothetical protein
MLPSRALQLIHEYVQPITRPDWRSFERIINPEVFITEIRDLTVMYKSNLFMRTYMHMRYSDFHTMYTWFEFSGVDSFIHFNGGCREEFLSNPWLSNQQRLYDNL